MRLCTGEMGETNHNIVLGKYYRSMYENFQQSQLHLLREIGVKHVT